jgi:two-component system chemotaxis response regulator CheY
MSNGEPLIITPFERLRLMVIDDDRAILDLVEAILRLVGVGSVTKSTSGMGALNILADHSKRVDGIICDHSMPHMTGISLLRGIRAGRYDNVARDIKFIMVTSHGQEAVVRAAVGLDVNGYIVKPINKDSLVKAIHRAFGRPLSLKTPGEYLAIAEPPEL